ncbi:MAG: hypothetical protein WBC33_09685 [Conexibacter sp.]
MARPRRFELDELTLRPGTYFNPDTEVLVVVDDSPNVDQAIFDDADGDAEGGEWVLVSDEVPLDEAARDELLERFQATYHSGSEAAGLGAADDEDELDEDEDDLEPDEELDDED